MGRCMKWKGEAAPDMPFIRRRARILVSQNERDSPIHVPGVLISISHDSDPDPDPDPGPDPEGPGGLRSTGGPGGSPSGSSTLATKKS